MPGQRRAADRGLADFAARFGDLFAQRDANAAAKSVEAAHVACLQTIFTALAHGDFDAAFSHLTPDTTYVIYAGGRIPFQMAGQGRAVVQEGMRTNFGAVAFERIDIDTLVAQGDVVVIVARQRGRWRESGVAFDERVMLEYVFAGDLVASYRGWILPFAP